MNKIRECPLYPHIVVTHTDAKELYVWDVEKQPNRADARVPALSWLCLSHLQGVDALTRACFMPGTLRLP